MNINISVVATAHAALNYVVPVAHVNVIVMIIIICGAVSKTVLCDLKRAKVKGILIFCDVNLKLSYQKTEQLKGKMEINFIF